MITVFSLTLLGFFLGMRHATDPDHVIAVSTIVTRQPTIRGALVIGSLWGVGHTLTILAVGAAIVFFAIVIPPRLGLSMEMAVALMLVVLGMWNLTGLFEQIRGMHPLQAAGAPQAQPPSSWALNAQEHNHANLVHSHVPDPAPGQPGRLHHRLQVMNWLDWRLGGLSAYQLLRPLIIGLVHGLAGSAAVALLVLGLIKNAWWAMAYLVLFGIGTIAGMMLITGAMGAVIAYASSRSYRLDRLRVASGFLSLSFGLFLVYQIAVVDGLVTGKPGSELLH
jgi:hypothetical protein